MRIWRTKTTTGVRALEQNNLIVPLVANFAGPKTLRAIGPGSGSGEKVTTFYASNVEQYLFQDGIWGQFAENMAACRSMKQARSSGRVSMCINSNINSRRCCSIRCRTWFGIIGRSHPRVYTSCRAKGWAW
jgi:hypothetical protein